MTSPGGGGGQVSLELGGLDTVPLPHLRRDGGDVSSLPSDIDSSFSLGMSVKEINWEARRFPWGPSLLEEGPGGRKAAIVPSLPGILLLRAGISIPVASQHLLLGRAGISPLAPADVGRQGV